MELFGYPSAKHWALGVIVFMALTLDYVIPQHQQQDYLVIQPRDTRVFQDMEHSKYFRYFQLDEDNGYLYVGAQEFVYRLNLTDVSKFDRSARLSATDEDIGYCMGVIGRTREYDCSNHVRSILFEDDHIYVCGTGAYTPREYTLDRRTLSQVTVGAASSGVGKCPHNPDQEATSIYIKNGNPGGKPAMYFGTAADESGDFSLIYRPKLDPNVGFVRTVPRDSKWLNKPSFVGSFEVGEYIYYFFREEALETQNCGKEIFSRVARVCKKDQGGMSTLTKTWTTFLKARLNCSIGGEYPYYFNHLRDVQQIGLNRFYALFTTSPTGFYGSAVCEFTLHEIEKAFNGTFKQQLQASMLWTATPLSDIPTPRPGQCIEDSRNLPDAVCQFLESRPLMDSAVQSGAPLYQRAGVLYQHMVLEHDVNGYTVLFLATAEGTVHKVVQYTDGDEIKSKLLAEWQVTDDASSQPIRTMQLHNKRLFVAQDYQVIQYGVGQCNSYTLCNECIQDPYCGWHIWRDECVDYTLSSSIRQDVTSNNPITSCNTQCRVDQQPTPTNVRVPGDSVQLSCRSRCAPDDDNRQSWRVFTSETNTYEPLVFPDDSTSSVSSTQHAIMNRNLVQGAGVFLTHNGSLVLTNVTSPGNMLFKCLIGSVTIAEHNVDVPDCTDAECLWREEFHKWCSAFDTYTKEFNEWLCLKKNCVSDDACVPTTISGQCIGT